MKEVLMSFKSSSEEYQIVFDSFGEKLYYVFNVVSGDKFYFITYNCAVDFFILSVIRPMILDDRYQVLESILKDVKSCEYGKS